MLIKILGNNERQLRDNIESVMNIACLVARRGSLPTERDINEKEPSRFWYENIEEKKFDLFPATNNHKAFIRERGENYIIVEFYYRYDTAGINESESLSRLILSIFKPDLVHGVIIERNSSFL